MGWRLPVPEVLCGGVYTTSAQRRPGQRYGAIPTIITHDVLEMKLPKPVDEKMALEVAKEHYAFTPDRVDQGTVTGTLSEVAASIAVSKGWFFWWD